MSRLLSILFVMGAAFASPAFADQDNPALEGLFNRLHSDVSPLEAQLIQRRIWWIWHETADSGIATLMDAGAEALSKGAYKQAIVEFSKVIEQAPEFAEGWNRRATVLYLDGQLEASLKDVDQVLTLEPRHFGAWSGAGQIYNQLDRKDEALRAFKKALAVNPYLTSAESMVKRLESEVEGDPI